jgi:hypothetical protein
MKIHISFAHGRYLKSQENCQMTAVQNAKFDDSIKYGISDIESSFFQKNNYILSCARGAGYWLWKPYLILKTLNNLSENDILVYSDSGISFVKSFFEELLPVEQPEDNGIISTGKCGKNSSFTKRDAFVLMNCDNLEYTSSSQITASLIYIRKKKNTISFVEEWLNFCQDPRVITDLPNTRGLPNYPDFVDHRHDQSIFSLLCKKHNVTHFEKGLCQFHRPDYFVLHHRNPA